MTRVRLVLAIGAGIAFAALLAAFLWQRNDLTRARDALTAEQRTTADLRAANGTLAKSLDVERSKRVDNDAIAAAVAARIGTIQTTETNTIVKYEKAKQDDPTVVDWSRQPVPDSVREAVAPAGRDGASAR